MVSGRRLLQRICFQCHMVMERVSAAWKSPGTTLGYPLCFSEKNNCFCHPHNQ